MVAHPCAKWNVRQWWVAWTKLLQLMAVAACIRQHVQLEANLSASEQNFLQLAFMLLCHLDSCRTRDDCLFTVFADALSIVNRSGMVVGATFADCPA